MVTIPKRKGEHSSSQQVDPELFLALAWPKQLSGTQNMFAHSAKKTKEYQQPNPTMKQQEPYTVCRWGRRRTPNIDRESI